MSAVDGIETRPPMGGGVAGEEVSFAAVLLPDRLWAARLGLSALSSATVAVVARVSFEWETWQVVALFLASMSVPALAKWRDDAARFGVVAAVAGALVTVQGVHSIEHAAQWVQRYVLGLSLRASNGLLSPANSEWVHFVWNWSILVVILFLFARGMRGWWAWGLVVWATAHTLEHSYLFVRYLQARAELGALGVTAVTAQGLPGVVGDGGWLDINAGPRLRYVCSLAGITTAPRLDAHFVWNAGEMLLLVPAVGRLLRGATITSSGRVAHGERHGDRFDA